ncbi:MAG: glycosyltransferase family 4 protein [Verrucomicrobia bacterium]|nr:glycosyltransferase family 4 protein [Verrucomicrobiota bacterium]
MYHLAYVFERFPSFTQTFCVREILELERQGLRPLIFSIRDTREEDESQKHFPPDLYERVHFLPQGDDLVEAVKTLKAEGKLPQSVVLTLRHWSDNGDRADKRRVHEAAYIGVKLQEAGVRHAHSHFAGIGARTCWWLKFFYDISYSFTGHANDLFCKTDFEVTLAKLMGDATLVVTVSDYTVRNLQGRFPESASKVKRVYNGLNLEPFRAAGHRRDVDAVWSGERLIFTVGRLIEKKGFDDLIKACAVMKKDGVKDFRGVIVGDGPLEDELQELIRASGVEDCVELAGPKSQDEIIAYLERAAIFALPCVTEKDGGKDNLPTVIMEAMGARVPCVSTILAGVPEMVIDGQTGRLVEERQVEDFAKAMADVLADKERAIEMGIAGEERALEIFAKEVTAKQMRRLQVSRGLVRFDARLTRDDPGLWFCYARQWVTRFLRMFCWRKKDRVG